MRESARYSVSAPSYARPAGSKNKAFVPKPSANAPEVEPAKIEVSPDQAPTASSLCVMNEAPDVQPVVTYTVLGATKAAPMGRYMSADTTVLGLE